MSPNDEPIDPTLDRLRAVKQLHPLVQAHLGDVVRWLRESAIQVRGLNLVPRSGALQLSLSRTGETGEEQGDIFLHYKSNNRLDYTLPDQRNSPLVQSARVCIQRQGVRRPGPLW